jgi:FMN-dependent NADH-azoreductase
VLRVIERFKAADKVLISAPMWNFSIPYPLKHYIDLLCQPGLTFYVNREGQYVGMVTGKPMQLILASGSEYAMRFPLQEDGTKTDFQRAYLEHIGRFIGFEDIRCLKVQPAAAHPKVVEPMLAEKIEQARQAATEF